MWKGGGALASLIIIISSSSCVQRSRTVAAYARVAHLRSWHIGGGLGRHLTPVYLDHRLLDKILTAFRQSLKSA